MEPPMAPKEEFDAPNMFPQPAAAPIAAALEHVERQQRKFAKVQGPVSVLESNGSCSRGKSLSAKSEHTIPARSSSKQARYSTSKQTSNARKSKQSRKRLFQQPFSIDLMRNTPENVDNSSTISDPTHQVASDAVVKKCSHCQSIKTPQWREGPLGPKTLCNACGVRYRSGRLFPEYRPAASPTFVPSQHSVSIDLMRNTPTNLDKPLTISDPAHRVASDAVVKKCSHCQSKKTPQWREGPLGPKTLCNACGVRYRSGRLFPEYRPAASPTFVPSQHSNSHRKVVEMRNEAKQVEVETKVAPLSPQAAAKIDEPLQLAAKIWNYHPHKWSVFP